MTEWARCLLGRSHIRWFFYQSPSASAHHATRGGADREGGQRPGATTLLRELKEQIRGEVWRGPHHVSAFFIREALLQVKRECLERNSDAWDAGHLQEGSQDHTQGMGYRTPQELKPLCPSVPGVLRSPRLEVRFPGPGVVDRLLSSQAQRSLRGDSRTSEPEKWQESSLWCSEALGGSETKMGPHKPGVCG